MKFTKAFCLWRYFTKNPHEVDIIRTDVLDEGSDADNFGSALSELLLEGLAHRVLILLRNIFRGLDETDHRTFVFYIIDVLGEDCLYEAMITVDADVKALEREVPKLPALRDLRERDYKVILRIVEDSQSLGYLKPILRRGVFEGARCREKTRSESLKRYVRRACREMGPSTVPSLYFILDIFGKREFKEMLLERRDPPRKCSLTKADRWYSTESLMAPFANVHRWRLPSKRVR